MSDHAEECNCIACRFGIVQVEAGVTGNEGKDEMESRGKDIAVGSSDSSGSRTGSAGAALPDPLASPAVVTPTQDSKIRGLILYLQSDFADKDDKERPLDQRWINIGPGTLAKILERFAKSKVSELEAKLQQAQESESKFAKVITTSHAVLDRAKIPSAMRVECNDDECNSQLVHRIKEVVAELERMRAGGKS